MICLIHAHPYPSRSRNIAALLQGAQRIKDIEVRSLYSLYPDFDIHVAAEQNALQRAKLIIWLHPLYWYSVPGLLKHWFDQVLTLGWAYGENGHALRGKALLWACSTGGNEASYQTGGSHAFSLQQLQTPIQQTAQYCGMEWQRPFIVHNAFQTSEAELQQLSLGFENHLREIIASC